MPITGHFRWRDRLYAGVSRDYEAVALITQSTRRKKAAGHPPKLPLLSLLHLAGVGCATSIQIRSPAEGSPRDQRKVQALWEARHWLRHREDAPRGNRRPL